MLRWGYFWILALVLVCVTPSRAHALRAVELSQTQAHIEVTQLGELYEGRGDSLQVETAPGADGLSGRMSVRAMTPDSNPNWLVFALTNSGDKAVERWLTADWYGLIGAGIVSPDLDGRRVASITPSIGFVPNRISNDRADVFRILLEPGQTVTYVAELASDRVSRVELWMPIEYEARNRNALLFGGMALGVLLFLAIFLNVMDSRPAGIAASLIVWCVAFYVSVEFGFFHRLFSLSADDNAVLRATAEATIAASLLSFLFVFLRLSLWVHFERNLFALWMLGQVALVALAIFEPRLAATFVRLSFAAIAAVGTLVVGYLAFLGQDRARWLLPAWVLTDVLIFGSGMIATGRISGDFVVPAFDTGLCLVALAIGFAALRSKPALETEPSAIRRTRAGGPRWLRGIRWISIRIAGIGACGATVLLNLAWLALWVPDSPQKSQGKGASAGADALAAQYGKVIVRGADGAPIGPPVRGHAAAVLRSMPLRQASALVSTDEQGATRLSTLDGGQLRGVFEFAAMRRSLETNLWLPMVKPLAGASLDLVAQVLSMTVPEHRRGGRGRVFRDCKDGFCGPQMVEIKPGTYFRGATLFERGLRAPGERRRLVEIATPFAVGRFEVTLEEWETCVEAGKCKPLPIGESSGTRAKLPVTGVSWDEVNNAYLPWLSEITGKRYRLLTESEWEYAARAGASGQWSFGDEEALLGAYAWYLENSGSAAHPVGEKRPNAFGLYDMHGNVQEWTQNCFSMDIQGTLFDRELTSETNFQGACKERVVRGGDHTLSSSGLRAAKRGSFPPSAGGHVIGLRVARTL